MTPESHHSPTDPDGPVDARGGRFSIGLRDEKWWWDDDVYRVLGFEVAEVVPTTALLRTHSEPAGRLAWDATLEHWRTSPAPLIVVQPMRDASGRAFDALVAGTASDRAGTPRVVEGYLVDLTGVVQARASRIASEQITASAQTRGVIEQAKGVVSAATGQSPAASFQLLRTASMRANIPLRRLARELVAEASRGNPDRLAEVLSQILTDDAVDGRTGSVLPEANLTRE